MTNQTSVPVRRRERTCRAGLAVLLLLINLSGGARAQADRLEEYVRQGLADNLAVQEKDFSLQKAANALQVARSMYRPSLSFDATYTTASGGRTTALPVGDLLNPVYSTLNQLTGSQLFPHIANQHINFLPKNYYDARIRATMPIINLDIGHNKRIGEKLVRMQGIQLEVYKRELVRDIKQAYYHYQSATAALGIRHSALLLAREGRRSAQKLLDAGRGKNGGRLMFAGTPEDLVKERDNETARFLREEMG